VILGDYRQLQKSTCAANVVAATDTALTSFLQKLTRTFHHTYSPGSNPGALFFDVKNQAFLGPYRALRGLFGRWRRGAFFAHGFPWVVVQDWAQLEAPSSKVSRTPP
jgi:hypothetical protein